MMDEFIEFHTDEAETRSARRVLHVELLRAANDASTLAAVKAASGEEHDECQRNIIAAARRGSNELPRYIYAAGVADRISRIARGAAIQ